MEKNVVKLEEFIVHCCCQRTSVKEDKKVEEENIE